VGGSPFLLGRLPKEKVAKGFTTTFPKKQREKESK